MGHLQLSRDLAGPDPLQRQLEDLHAKVVRERAPVSETPPVLVDVLRAATAGLYRREDTHMVSIEVQ